MRRRTFFGTLFGGLVAAVMPQRYVMGILRRETVTFDLNSPLPTHIPVLYGVHDDPVDAHGCLVPTYVGWMKVGQMKERV